MGISPGKGMKLSFRKAAGLLIRRQYLMRETDFSALGRVVFILGILGYVFTPFLFVWSVNTLFLCDIPFTFKTWLAGFVLIMLARFHLKASVKTLEPYYDDEEDEDGENSKPEQKGNVIAHTEEKDRKNPPSDTP